MIVGTEEVERVRKTKDYAFIHFRTREAAEIAYSKCNALSEDKKTKKEFKIEDSVIEVAWGKPVDKQNYNARKLLTKMFSEHHGGGGSSGERNGGGGGRLNRSYGGGFLGHQQRKFQAV